MNNNIQESYCSFEVSKLLKEKGFNVGSKLYYNDDELGKEFGLCNVNILYKNSYPNNIIEVPTHSLAIEWIRVNFGIWIQTLYSYTDSRDEYHYHYEIFYRNNRVRKFKASARYYNSPQEATEAALLYTLQNLIK